MKAGIKFIIRCKKNSTVLDIDYFDKIKWKLNTQSERETTWLNVEEMVTELEYHKQKLYDWFEV